jgi:hypothetical protein
MHMAKDPDKVAKVKEILAECGGRTERMDDGTVTVTIPADKDNEFRAALSSAKLTGYRANKPQGDNSTDINWYTIEVRMPGNS